MNINHSVMEVRALLSDGGDRFGLRRGGLTFRRLAREYPHGVVLAPHLRTGILRDVVAYRDGRVRLIHDDIADEIVAPMRRTRPDDYPMRMISMREPRSENSWVHNTPMLMRGKRIHRALKHAEDASGLGIADGDTVQVRSEHGRIELPVSLTADIVAGRLQFRTAGGTRAPAAGNWPTAPAGPTSTH